MAAAMPPTMQWAAARECFSLNSREIHPGFIVETLT
jgi:hypothetical protein